MISTAVSRQQLPLPCPTIIVDQYSDRSLVSELQSSFANLTGQEVPVKAFPFLNASDLYCVYVPLDHPTWRHVSEDRFNHLRQMILRAKGLLWVTRGAAMQSPDAAMSTGVARAVRSENAGINLITLDLDGKTESPNAHMIETIQNLYRHHFQSQGFPTSTDSEYLERDGVLQIQRAVLNHEKDEFVIRETKGATSQPQRFVQEERLLKLKLGTPGRLDSLYFADDESLRCDIGENQVEIEIKSAGVSCRIAHSFQPFLSLTRAWFRMQRCNQVSWQERCQYEPWRPSLWTFCWDIWQPHPHIVPSCVENTRGDKLHDSSNYSSHILYGTLLVTDNSQTSERRVNPDTRCCWRRGPSRHHAVPTFRCRDICYLRLCREKRLCEKYLWYSRKSHFFKPRHYF